MENSLSSPSVFIPSSISLTTSLFPSQNPIHCSFCAVPLGVGRYAASGQPGTPENYGTGFYYPVRTFPTNPRISGTLSDSRAIQRSRFTEARKWTCVRGAVTMGTLSVVCESSSHVTQTRNFRWYRRDGGPGVGARTAVIISPFGLFNSRTSA